MTLVNISHGATTATIPEDAHNTTPTTAALPVIETVTTTASTDTHTPDSPQHDPCGLSKAEMNRALERLQDLKGRLESPRPYFSNSEGSSVNILLSLLIQATEIIQGNSTSILFEMPTFDELVRRGSDMPAVRSLRRAHDGDLSDENNAKVREYATAARTETRSKVTAGLETIFRGTEKDQDQGRDLCELFAFMDGMAEWSVKPYSLWGSDAAPILCDGLKEAWSGLSGSVQRARKDGVTDQQLGVPKGQLSNSVVGNHRDRIKEVWSAKDEVIEHASRLGECLPELYNVLEKFERR